MTSTLGSPTHMSSTDPLMTSDGEPPVRLVIDLTWWPATSPSKQLFESIRTHFIGQRLEPAVLLLTHGLYDNLPRSFDDERWLRVERLDAAAAAARVLELATDGALLASRTPQQPPERWLAMDIDKKSDSLVLEPADGVAGFARDGVLALPPLEYDLADWISDDALPKFNASRLGPIETRRLIERLRSEDADTTVDSDPRKRLAMARALGVGATATTRDRTEAELRAAAAALDMPVPTMESQELDTLLEKARLRGALPTALRVDDEIHIINPTATQPGLDHARVRVHRIEAPEPMISRLRTAVADWTLGDFEADPFLVATMDRIDPDGREALPLLHARAWLLSDRTLRPPPGADVEDWRTALRSILGERVPPAALMLGGNDEEKRDDAYYSVPLSGDLADTLSPLDESTVKRLRHPPTPLDAVPFDRDTPICRASPFEFFAHFADPAAALDVRWLDAYEALLGAPQHARHRIPVATSPISQPPPWSAADQLLASVWLSLRAAVDNSPAVRGADGLVTLSLGGGIAAEISLTRTAGDVGSPRAMMRCRKERSSGWGGDWNLKLTTDLRSGIDYVDYTVPLGLVLLAGKMRAEVTYTASPLLLGLGQTSHAVGPALQAAHHAVRAAAEEKRRRDDDDD